MIKKIFIYVVFLMSITGCISDPVVESTKSWENHYMTVDAFKNGTSGIVLEKNESIWVISNNTLKRLLKNTEK